MTICKETDCPGKVLARSWCRKHYLRWRKHGDPSVTLNRWGQDKYAETKVCGKCERELPVDNFYKRSGSTGYVHRCKECWGPSPEKKRERNLRRYGLTLQQYDELLKNQGGGCAICRKSESGESGNCLSVDHDHLTGKVRGLLCYSCNAGIGMFRDDPALLTGAVIYLVPSSS